MQILIWFKKFMQESPSTDDICIDSFPFCIFLQRIVCKLIKDTVDCVNLHAKCYSPAEIREDKDRHIAGRVQQFAKDDTVNVRKCPVVKEYQDSGRADVKASEDEKCTKGQVRMAKVKCHF